MKVRVLSALAIVTAGACGGGVATQPPADGAKGASSVTPSASAASSTSPPSASASASASALQPPRPPMIELQKKSVKAAGDAFNAHHAIELSLLYAVDAVIVEQGLAGVKETRGREEIERMYAGLFRSFPDAKLAASRVFAVGDVIVVEMAWAGTNTGPTPIGGKPTNKKVGQRAVSLQVLGDGGQIKREEVFMDDLTVAMQLGIPGVTLTGAKPRAVPELPAGEPQWVVEADDKALEAAKASGWTSFYTKHDRKGFEAALTDESVHFDDTLPADAKGKKALLAEYDQWLRTFPDLKVDVGTGWGFKDGWSVYAFTTTGTMKGAWGPNRPTSKPVTVHGIAIDQQKDGKLVQSSTFVNGVEPLGQINPPKPASPRR
jgi:hypothetical protein